MVSIDIWLAFVAAACVLNFMPGPSMMLVIAQAVSKGAQACIGTIIGIVMGDALLIALSMFGLAAVLATSAELFVLMKWLGAFYLVYLGVMQWRAEPAPTDLDVRHFGVSLTGVRQGMVVTLLNPKVIAFHIAFFPQFVDDGAALAPQMLVLGTTFLLLAAVSMGLYAFAADRVKRMSGGLRSPRVLNRISGVVLVSCGLFVASLKRT